MTVTRDTHTEGETQQGPENGDLFAAAGEWHTRMDDDEGEAVGVRHALEEAA